MGFGVWRGLSICFNVFMEKMNYSQVSRFILARQTTFSNVALQMISFEVLCRERFEIHLEILMWSTLGSFYKGHHKP